MAIRCCIHSCTKLGVIASLTSAGLLPVIALPLLRTPLPQSVRHGSTDCCAPSLATLKPQP